MTKLCVNTPDECRIACKMILDKGCGSVILTMGASGAMYVNRHQALHIPVPTRIEPVDTTVRSLKIKLHNHPYSLSPFNRAPVIPLWEL